MGRLSEAQREPLSQEDERVQEPAGQRDVVVDDHKPVVPAGGVLREQRIQVLELAPVTGVSRGEADLVV